MSWLYDFIIFKVQGKYAILTNSIRSMFRCSAPFDLFFAITANSMVLCTFIYIIKAA